MPFAEAFFLAQESGVGDDPEAALSVEDARQLTRQRLTAARDLAPQIADLLLNVINERSGVDPLSAEAVFVRPAEIDAGSHKPPTFWLNLRFQESAAIRSRRAGLLEALSRGLRELLQTKPEFARGTYDIEVNNSWGHSRAVESGDILGTWGI